MSFRYSLIVFLGLLFHGVGSTTLVKEPGVLRERRVKKSRTLQLTEAEKKWMQAHNGQIRLAPDPFFPPYEFFNEEDRYIGIGADIMKLIQEKTGLQFQIVKYASWEDVINAAKKREVDAFTLAAPTPQRKEYMNFTKAYFRMKAVFITRKESAERLALDKMAGMKVSMSKDYAWYDVISMMYPEIDIDTVPNALTGLRKVSFGSSDIQIVSMAVASYYISQEGISNLKVAGETNLKVPLASAVRSDWPELVSIMNKGIDLISETEMHQIIDKWIFNEKKRFYQTERFWYIVLAIVLTLGVLSIVTVIVNRRLKAVVKEKTIALRLEKQHLKSINQKLHDALVKAEESDRLSKAILANISHEIRTPMNSIMGFSQVLQIEDLNPEERNYYTDLILKGANKLEDIISDIINVSKIDSDIFKPNWTRVTIGEIKDELATKYKARIEKEHLKIAFDFPRAVLKKTIHSDAVILVQILGNILNNAIKYAPDGKISVGCQCIAEAIEFYVSDNGIGIPADKQEEIFKPFVQLENEINEKQRGTGLGLTLAQKLATLLGSNIVVDSEPSRGSRFSFKINRSQ